MAVPVEAPRIWLIAGPTASGKSALALHLAERIGGEIINADALQLYRDLSVLTARPTAEDEARAPHHLFGVADAAEGWSVGRWLEAAKGTLSKIAGPAIVVGGTGLYFKALTQGLADIPAVPAAVRVSVGERFDRLGEGPFRSELARVDAASAGRIAPGDRQRLCRAMEVFEATGRSITDWQGETAATLRPDQWRGVVLEPDRQALYARCDERLGWMVEHGALEEVRALSQRNLDPALPALKAVGYREFAAHVAGEITLEKALAAARQETRRYAKRQMTWFRNQTPDWPRIDVISPEEQQRQFFALNPSLTPLP